MVYKYGRMTKEQKIMWEILLREKQRADEEKEYEDRYYNDLYEANGGDFVYGGCWHTS